MESFHLVVRVHIFCHTCLVEWDAVCIQKPLTATSVSMISASVFEDIVVDVRCQTSRGRSPEAYQSVPECQLCRTRIVRLFAQRWVVLGVGLLNCQYVLQPSVTSWVDYLHRELQRMDSKIDASKEEVQVKVGDRAIAYLHNIECLFGDYSCAGQAGRVCRSCMK